MQSLYAVVYAMAYKVAEFAKNFWASAVTSIEGSMAEIW
jgi:hypothetical protein